MAEDASGDGRPHFMDHMVSREHRFSLGIETRSGQPYVSIPVSNQMADYEEHYAIDRNMFDRFMAEPDEALAFVARCRRREEDARLFHQPGGRRGAP
jgi:hypothetical protein